jgi:rRNA processing protein Krr1/Pno1
VHENFVRLATRLINKNGRAAKLVSYTETGDAWNPARVETTTDIVLVQTRFKQDEIDGSLIKSDDFLFLIDSSVEPKTDMKIRDDSVDYSIINVIDITPADNTIMYRVQCRR